MGGKKKNKYGGREWGGGGGKKKSGHQSDPTCKEGGGEAQQQKEEREDEKRTMTGEKTRRIVKGRSRKERSKRKRENGEFYEREKEGEFIDPPWALVRLPSILPWSFCPNSSVLHSPLSFRSVASPLPNPIKIAFFSRPPPHSVLFFIIAPFGLSAPLDRINYMYIKKMKKKGFFGGPERKVGEEGRLIMDEKMKD